MARDWVTKLIKFFNLVILLQFSHFVPSKIVGPHCGRLRMLKLPVLESDLCQKPYFKLVQEKKKISKIIIYLWCIIIVNYTQLKTFL